MTATSLQCVWNAPFFLMFWSAPRMTAHRPVVGRRIWVRSMRPRSRMALPRSHSAVVPTTGPPPMGVDRGSVWPLFLVPVRVPTLSRSHGLAGLVQEIRHRIASDLT
eukprot:scaffold840_cov344-Pavlova_lutheri.AAC.122